MGRGLLELYLAQLNEEVSQVRAFGGEAPSTRLDAAASAPSGARGVWQARPDLNRQPRVLGTVALPVELLAGESARPALGAS